MRSTESVPGLGEIFFNAGLMMLPGMYSMEFYFFVPASRYRHIHYTIDRFFAILACISVAGSKFHTWFVLLISLNYLPSVFFLHFIHSLRASKFKVYDIHEYF